MGREDIKAGRAFVELGVSDKMAAGLNAASRRLRAFGGAVRNIGAGVLGAGVAILAPVAMATRQYAAYGDHLQKLSLRLGIGVRDLSLFHHAAKMAGIESRTFDMAMQRMTRRVAEAAQGTGEAKDAIRTLLRSPPSARPNRCCGWPALFRRSQIRVSGFALRSSSSTARVSRLCRCSGRAAGLWKT